MNTSAITPSASAVQQRTPTHVTSGTLTSDGAGVRLRRLLGGPGAPAADPFLMLDYFDSPEASDYIAGFPPHPHRGFETVTYMLAGRMRHRDNKGHEGVIETGGVQWMTAGRGIVHSEMPEQESGLMRGFQLWVNLPGRLKMNAPGYQEYGAARFPVEQRAGATVKVIAGATAAGTEGPIRTEATQAHYFDIALDAGATWQEPVAPELNAFVVAYEGTVRVGGPAAAGARTLEAPALALLGAGTHVTLSAGDAPARALLIAGRPLREPVAWHGPFVMNTREELIQAFEDFQSGRF
jgi:hypothetical protein